ncbi:hypothetical protein JHK85_010359 [Glycine max]|nr:hypothetical protein JHK85_010359 [Glycine max]
MCRSRGKGKKLTISNEEDAISEEEEKVPKQKRRGRPQKLYEEDFDEEEIEEILEEDATSGDNVMNNEKCSLPEQSQHSAAEFSSQDSADSAAANSADCRKVEIADSAVATASSPCYDNSEKGYSLACAVPPQDEMPDEVTGVRANATGHDEVTNNVFKIQNFYNGVFKCIVLTYLRTAYKDGHPRPTSLNVSRALHMGLKMVTYLRNCHRYSYYDVYGGNDVERAS